MPGPGSRRGMASTLIEPHEFPDQWSDLNLQCLQCQRNLFSLFENKSSTSPRIFCIVPRGAGPVLRRKDNRSRAPRAPLPLLLALPKVTTAQAIFELLRLVRLLFGHIAHLQSPWPSSKGSAPPTMADISFLLLLVKVGV